VIALGVVIILLVALVTVFAVIASGTVSTGIALTGLGITITARPISLFVAGALSVVLLGVGISLVSRGTRRKAGKRKELKTLRKEHAAPATQTTDNRGGVRTDEGTRESGTTTKDRGGMRPDGGMTGDSRADNARAPRSDAPPPRRGE
jgi:hypothetical protein